MSTVLFTCHHLLRNADKFVPMVEKEGIEVRCPAMEGQQFTADQMVELIDGVDVVIAGDDAVTRDVIAAGKASRLKAIVKWGIGTDGIDKPAARELGIPVYNTPGVFSDEVADLAFTLLLMLCRPVHKMHRSVSEGDWKPISGRTLSGLTVGVIGLGAIGRAVAKRCDGFGMAAVGYDPVALGDAVLRETGVAQVALDELYRTSDVVIVACALTANNRHMLNADAFAKMKDGVFVINVGRGPIVDEAALIAALETGKVGAAGLDVFEVEPLPMASGLRRFDNVVFGCHNGSNTVQAVDKVNRMTVDMALKVLGKQGDPTSGHLNQVV